LQKDKLKIMEKEIEKLKGELAAVKEARQALQKAKDKSDNSETDPNASNAWDKMEEYLNSREKVLEEYLKKSN